MKLSLVLIALSLAGLSSSAFATDPNLGRDLAATCANCHGTNGKPQPNSGMDSLAGMPKELLLRKLHEFRSGTKPATVMHQISKGYSETQLELIATYFAAQK